MFEYICFVLVFSALNLFLVNKIVKRLVNSGRMKMTNGERVRVALFLVFVVALTLIPVVSVVFEVLFLCWSYIMLTN